MQVAGGMMLWLPAYPPVAQWLALLVGFSLIAIPLFVLFAGEFPRGDDRFWPAMVRLTLLGGMTAVAALLGGILAQAVLL